MEVREALLGEVVLRRYLLQERLRIKSRLERVLLFLCGIRGDQALLDKVPAHYPREFAVEMLVVQ